MADVLRTTRSVQLPGLYHHPLHLVISAADAGRTHCAESSAQLHGSSSTANSGPREDDIMPMPYDHLLPGYSAAYSPHILSSQYSSLKDMAGNDADAYGLQALANTASSQYYELSNQYCAQDHIKTEVDLDEWRRSPNGDGFSDEGWESKVAQTLMNALTPATYNSNNSSSSNSNNNRACEDVSPDYHHSSRHQQPASYPLQTATRPQEGHYQHLYASASPSSSPPRRSFIQLYNSQHHPIGSNTTMSQSQYPSSEASSDGSRHGGSSFQTFEEQELKRLRNTAASARFRAKKKRREQSLERNAREKREKLAALESRIVALEAENRWLKNLILENNDGGSQAPRSDNNNGVLADNRKEYTRQDELGI